MPRRNRNARHRKLRGRTLRRAIEKQLRPSDWEYSIREIAKNIQKATGKAVEIGRIGRPWTPRASMRSPNQRQAA